LVAYVLWNGYWLAGGQVPPSMLRELVGWPVPSTGMTRSLVALLDGQWATSLYWNALTVPVLGLYLASLGTVGWLLVHRRRLALPRWQGWAWGVLLIGAWIVKLVQGPASW